MKILDFYDYLKNNNIDNKIIENIQKPLNAYMKILNDKTIDLENVFSNFDDTISLLKTHYKLNTLKNYLKFLRDCIDIDIMKNILDINDIKIYRGLLDKSYSEVCKQCNNEQKIKTDNDTNSSLNTSISKKYNSSSNNEILDLVKSLVQDISLIKKDIDEIKDKINRKDDLENKIQELSRELEYLQRENNKLWSNYNSK